MKILVIGCGSIGERHIRNLKKLGIKEILAADIDKKRLLYISKKYKIDLCFNNFKEALKKKVDAAVICTPPNSHISMGLTVIGYRVHIFIEKPLSNRFKGVDEFIEKSEKRNLVVLVGYNLRFHPGLQLVKEILSKGTIGPILSARAEFGYYLPKWRPEQDYRRSYTARKALGGGIILEASHEIDYLRWLLGDVKKVTCVADKVSGLDIETEDIAEVLLEFKSGTIAEIHLDFIRHDYFRHCELIGEKGTMIWNYSENCVKVYSAKRKKWQNFNTKRDSNEMYLQEMKHFINCILKKEKPLTGAKEGKEALKIALAAKKSACLGRKVVL